MYFLTLLLWVIFFFFYQNVLLDNAKKRKREKRPIMFFFSLSFATPEIWRSPRLLFFLFFFFGWLGWIGSRKTTIIWFRDPVHEIEIYFWGNKPAAERIGPNLTKLTVLNDYFLLRAFFLSRSVHICLGLIPFFPVFFSLYML